MYPILLSNKPKKKNYSEKSEHFPCNIKSSPIIFWSALKTQNDFRINENCLNYNVNNFDVIQRVKDIEKKILDEQSVFDVFALMFNKHPELKNLESKIDAKNIHRYFPMKEISPGKYRTVEKYTEREIQEQLIKGLLRDQMINAYLSDKRNRAYLGETDILHKTMCECWYFHATKKNNIENIYFGGLSPQEGANKNGISTNGINKQNLQESYEQWSKGYTFITSDFNEANHYMNKLGGKEKSVILDIFIGPALHEHLYIDPDSKGLKCNQEIKAIGDGKKLNSTAVGLLSELIRVKGQMVTKEEVQAAYVELYEKRSSMKKR